MKEEREDDALPCFVEIPGSGEMNIKRENCNMIDSKLAFVCDECGKEYKTKSHLKRHIQIVHHKIRVKCDKCDFKATDKTTVERHSLVVHENVKTRYTCTICSHHVYTSSALKKHNASVHEGVRYPCNLCQYKAVEKNSLRTHMIAIHTETKFKCDQCNLQTNFKSNLITHKKYMHKNPGEFKCNQENFKFKEIPTQEMIDKHEYMEHMNVNLPKTRIVFIPKESKDKDKKSNLDLSISQNLLWEERIDALVEHGEDGWTCKQCGKHGRNKSKARNHIETHIEGFTFSCTACEKTFSKRIHLKKHISLMRKHLQRRTT